MRNNCFLLIFAVLVLAVSAVTAQAQDATVQELERKLQERDKVILELLDRVDALERQIGIQRPAAATSGKPSGEQNPAPGIEQPPGEVVVEKGATERALERALTREGALLLPSGVLENESGISYARQEDSTPSFVTSGNQTFAGEMERNSDSLTADLALRMGLPWDSQMEIGIPYRWREVESVTNVNFAPTNSSSRSGSGIGDLRISLAKTLLREGLLRPDLIGRFTWDTDTGDSQDNQVFLGGGYNELKGSLTAIKRQEPVVFVGGLSYEYTLEKDQVQPGPTVGMNLGSLIALSPETALSLFFLAGHQNETELNGGRIAGSDRTFGSIELGGSTLLARGTLLSLSTGIGLTDDADDFSLSLSLTKRFDKPLF
jgi:hypothetical protein